MLLKRLWDTYRYGGKTKHMRLFICPNLSQQLYIAMDVWRAFGNAPVIIGDLSVEPVAIDSVPIHILSPSDQVWLDGVVAFPPVTRKSPFFISDGCISIAKY